MDTPYLMDKRNFHYVPNNPEIFKQHENDVIPITVEQAQALDREGRAAGLKILRAVVAADNAAALAEAEATAEPVPAQAEAPAAPVDLKDLPLAELREMAKKAGGFPDGKDVDKASRRELLAILQD